MQERVPSTMAELAQSKRVLHHWTCLPGKNQCFQPLLLCSQLFQGSIYSEHSSSCHHQNHQLTLVLEPEPEHMLEEQGLSMKAQQVQDKRGLHHLTCLQGKIQCFQPLLLCSQLFQGSICLEHSSSCRHQNHQLTLVLEPELEHTLEEQGPSMKAQQVQDERGLHHLTC